ncbi:MAG: hypothetical protein WC683_11520, partial [bacterium]
LIAENLVDPEPPAVIVIEEWDGIEDAPVAHETEARSSFYESRLAGLLGNDAERVDRFVLWLVESGRWNAISEVAKEERRGPLERVLNEWIKSYETSAPSQTNTPWTQISEAKAQGRFNSLFREIVNKDVVIDWDQRVTQGVQNTDVLKVLAWIKDIDTIEADRSTRIVGMINNLMIHLRDTYKPDSYFKTDVDGPALTSIMQRFVWLIG